MTTYYKKLDTSFLPHPIDSDKIKGDILFNYGYARYYKITDSEYLKSLSCCFKIPPKRIFLSEGHGPLLPHYDNGQDSCINYYMRPGGYTTSFWVPQENARRRKGKRYNSTTDSYVEVELGYMYEDLTLVDSFVAKDGEAYILNIKEVHSVEGANPELPRAFIQLQWDFTMDELIEKLGF
jgi:hypothetical protein